MVALGIVMWFLYIALAAAVLNRMAYLAMRAGFCWSCGGHGDHRDGCILS